MKYISGLFLGIAFLFVFIAILMLLSSLELQNAALDAKGQSAVAATLGAIKNDVASLDAADRNSIKRTQEVDELQTGINASREDNNDNFDAMEEAEKKLQGIIRNFADKTADFPRNLALPPRPANSGSDPVNLDDRLDTYFGYLDTYDQQRQGPTPASWSKNIDTLHQATASAIASYTKARSGWERASNELFKNQTRLTSLQNAKDTPQPARLNDANYKSLVEDFQENEWLFGFLAFIPHTMLVLLLALSMGMLGSLIFLSRDLIMNDKTRGIGEMSFRIGLGAAVALALFCFASAGVLSLSDGSHSTTNMSPYLISFLGITAGYLSDRVTDWMREVGEKTFKVEDAQCPDRWGVGLSAEIQKQDIDKGQLAKTTRQAIADVNSWCSLTAAVPCEAQSALACYLRVHPSGLFTDIDPN